MVKTTIHLAGSMIEITEEGVKIIVEDKQDKDLISFSGREIEATVLNREADTNDPPQATLEIGVIDDLPDDVVKQLNFKKKPSNL